MKRDQNDGEDLIGKVFSLDVRDEATFVTVRKRGYCVLVISSSFVYCR